METFSYSSWWSLRVFRTFGQTVKTLNACISGVLYFFFNSTPLKTPFDRLLNYLKLPVWCCSLLSKFQCFKVRTDVEMVKHQGLNFQDAIASSIRRHLSNLKNPCFKNIQVLHSVLSVWPGPAYVQLYSSAKYAAAGRTAGLHQQQPATVQKQYRSKYNKCVCQSVIFQSKTNNEWSEGYGNQTALLHD